jgi:hypothetical protein
MPTRSDRLAALFVVAGALALPTAARAAPASATITSCKGDQMSVAGQVALTGKDARKARGATLQIRFRALALFGLPETGDWHVVGKRMTGSRRQLFTGLGFDSWVGVVDWRFLKGRRTVLAGFARSQPGRGGRASCVLDEGAKPVDSTAPALFVTPADDSWHHAPAPVAVTAQDDFSGVKTVRYSLDGGPATPIPNGGTFTIPSEGTHALSVAATDVAGNTATRNLTIKVDANAPSKPAFVKPASVTVNRTPVFQWTASTDSASGLRGYLLTIERQDGSVVARQSVDASTTSLTSPVTLDDNNTYIAIVTAADNTADPAWATNSDPFAFRVDTTPAVDSTTPASGSIVSKSGNFVLNLDRAADPSTVNPTNVVLRNFDTNSNVSTTVTCAAAPCNKITVDPQSDLPEARYTLTVNNVKSDEGAVFASFTGKYSVPFTSPGDTLSVQPPLVCPATTTTSMAKAYPLTSPVDSDMGTVDFDWSANGDASWTVEIDAGSTAVAIDGRSNGGSGHIHLGPFGLASTIAIKLVVDCPPSTTVNLTNIVGARVP